LQRKNVWVPSSPQDGVVVAASIQVFVHVTLHQKKAYSGPGLWTICSFHTGFEKAS
jgi:hypothetical protein